jgi:RES domain-containing protein
MAAAPRKARVRLWERPLPDAVVAAGDRLFVAPRIQIAGTLHRAVYAKYLDPAVYSPPQPLYYLGSLDGRRFTPRKGPAGLYLSFDSATPMAELRTVIFHDGVPEPDTSHEPVLVVAIDIVVGRVLDLTQPSVRTMVGLKRSELLSDWERGQEEYLAGRGPMPPTQILAFAAHASGEFAGIKYPSARAPFGTNLVVFPDRLDPACGDSVEVVDPRGRYSQRLP